MSWHRYISITNITLIKYHKLIMYSIMQCLYLCCTQLFTTFATWVTLYSISLSLLYCTQLLTILVAWVYMHSLYSSYICSKITYKLFSHSSSLNPNINKILWNLKSQYFRHKTQIINKSSISHHKSLIKYL